MTKDQRPYYREILDRIRRIENYTAGGRAAFLELELLQDEVIRSFEVIGEVVKQLDPAQTAQYPAVTWSDFASFRDVLLHQYQHVRLDLVWGIRPGRSAGAQGGGDGPAGGSGRRPQL